MICPIADHRFNFHGDKWRPRKQTPPITDHPRSAHISADQQTIIDLTIRGLIWSPDRPSVQAILRCMATHKNKTIFRWPPTKTKLFSAGDSQRENYFPLAHGFFYGHQNLLTINLEAGGRHSSKGRQIRWGTPCCSGATFETQVWRHICSGRPMPVRDK